MSEGPHHFSAADPKLAREACEVRLSGDSPPMRLLSDGRCRLQSRDLFKPNTPYEAEKGVDGSVRLVELVPKEIPVVKPRRTKEAFLMLPVKLDRQTVRAAVR